MELKYLRLLSLKRVMRFGIYLVIMTDMQWFIIMFHINTLWLYVALKKKSNKLLRHYGVFLMKKPKKATHLDIWGSYWKINKHGFSFHDGKMWILCSNNRIWRDHLKNGNIFEVWYINQIIEVCVMFGFLKRLFCIHQYDYESDIFVQVECRKCSKIKKWK